MKKFSKTLLVLLVIMLVAVTAITAYACGEEDGDDTTPTPSEPKKVVVLQDGDSILKMLNDIDELDSYVPATEDVSMTFGGWYVDKALSTEYDSSQEVSTLYVKWVKKTFTVKFLSEGNVLPVNGSYSQTVEYGASAIAPEDPVKPGVTFLGWNVPFNYVTSNLTVTALFSSEPKLLTFYAEDGTELFSEEFMEGVNVTSYFNAQLVRAEELLPGGIQFDTWCIDEERQIAFTETGDIIMGSEPMTLYARATMKDIEQLKIIPSRNNFRYDLEGFDLVADFLDYNVITYSYKWFRTDSPELVLQEGDNATLSVPCQDAGTHSYTVEVTASYKNYIDKIETAVGTVTVELGKLEGISVADFTTDYTGTSHTVVVSGTLPTDSVTYRLKGQSSYSNLSIKDAGTYTIETRVERKNYEPIEFLDKDVKSNKLVINKIALTLTADNKSIQYGANAPTYTYNSDGGFVNGETIDSIGAEVTISCAYAKGNNVGEYDIEIKCSTLTNYDVTLVNSTLEVSKIALTINVTNASVTYGDNSPTYNCTFVGLDKTNANEEALVRAGVRFVCDYSQGSSAGTYDITAVAELDNYNATINKGTLTVNKKAVTVTATNKTITYGGDAPKYTYTITGLVLNENVKDAFGVEPTLTCAYLKGDKTNGVVKDNGYAIVASGLNSDNYAVSYVNGKLTVKKASLKLSAIDQTIKYGDNAPKASELTIKAEGLVAGDVLSYNDIVLYVTNRETTQSYSKGSPVGSHYDISLGTYDTNNYTVSYGKAVLTVEPRELEIIVLPTTIVYGEGVQDILLDFEGFYGRENESVLDFSGMRISEGYAVGGNIGTYDVKVEGITSPNYNVVCKNAGEITVIKRDLSITIRAYDDINELEPWSHTISSSDAKTHITIDNLYEFDQIAGVIQTKSGLFGSYILKGSVLDENFNWVTELSIVRDQISMIDNYNISYNLQVEIGTYGMLISGEDVYYDGKAHTLSVESFYENAVVMFGLEEGNYNISVDNLPEFTDAGTYTIYYKVWDKTGLLIGELLSSKVINIDRRPIEIVVNNVNITYGDELPAFGYALQGMGFIEGDTLDGLDGELSITSDSYQGNAGKYAIVASGVDSANYEIIFVDGVLNVDKRDLEIRAENKEMVYGDAIPEYTVKYSGFVNGDTYDSLGGLSGIIFECAFNNNKRAGTFDINPVIKEQEWDNYYLLEVSGSLVVHKKAMTLSVVNKSVSYGDETPSFTAKSNDFAYDDTLSAITYIDYATEYVKGSNVGKYAIIISATSDRYDLTLVDGTLTVNKKSVAVDWVGHDASYTYDGTDRTNSVTASYKSAIDGQSIVATVTFSKKSNVFLTAGEYTVTATTADTNYTLTNNAKTITMKKADYVAKSHDGFVGVYDPNTALKDYKLTENFFWAYENNVPNCVDKEYRAYYNDDAENYNNYYFDITIDLEKADVGLAMYNTTIVPVQEILVDYNGGKLDITPTIYYQDMVVLPANYTLSFTNGYLFDAGTYKTVMTFTADNYQMESTITYYVRYKSVKIGESGTTLYTIEDALNASNSGDTLIVTATTNFGDRNIVGEYFYNNDSYYTIKSGVTLLLPFSADDVKGYLPGDCEEGSTDYKAHPETYGETALYITLGIPTNVTLNVNGTLTIGAVTSAQAVVGANAGLTPNRVNGSYATINLLGNIVVNDGANLNAYGYINGSGVISTNGTATITENVTLNGWMGGTIAAARFTGGYTIGATSLLSAKTITDEDFGHEPAMFPYNDYTLDAITVRMELNYGSVWRGYIKIATSAQEALGMSIVNAKISETYITFAASNPNDDSTGTYRILDSGSKIIKTTTNGRMKLEMFGDIADGYTTLNVAVLKLTVKMASRKVFMPITRRTDIVVYGTFTQDYKVKFMPGATLTVNEGATYTLNGSAITYEKGFVDVAIGSTYGKYNENNAYVMVNGTMNINGEFGGEIRSSLTGKVNVSSSANTSVVSKEGTGSQGRSGLSVVLTYTEDGTITRTMTLINASGTTMSGTAGTNYSYSNGSWS